MAPIRNSLLAPVTAHHHTCSKMPWKKALSCTRESCATYFFDDAKRSDDIALGYLLSGWPNDARCRNMRAMLDKLKSRYGIPNDPASPCWNFNKRLAHSTSHRGREYDYRNILNEFYPVPVGN